MQQHHSEQGPEEDDQDNPRRRSATTATQSLMRDAPGGSALEELATRQFEDFEAHNASPVQVDNDLPKSTADEGGETSRKKKKEKRKKKKKKKRYDTATTIYNEEAIQLALGESMMSSNSSNCKSSSSLVGARMIIQQQEELSGKNSDGKEKYKDKASSSRFLQEEENEFNADIMSTESRLSTDIMPNLTRQQALRRARSEPGAHSVESPPDINNNARRLTSIAAANLAIAQRYAAQQSAIQEEYDAESGGGVIGEENNHRRSSDYSAHVSAELVGDAAALTEEELRDRIFRESVRAEVVEESEDEQKGWKYCARKYWWALSLLCLVVVGATVVAVVFVSGGDGKSPATGSRDVFITISPSLSPSFQPSTSEPTIQPSTNEMQVRYAFLNEVVRSISGETLDVPESPQRQAFQWLLSEDCALCAAISSTNAVFFKERYALAVLYFATGGPQWSEDAGFLSPEHHCTWKVSLPSGILLGVIGCTDGIVYEVFLANNQVKGTLPAELGSLTSLLFLSLPSNQLFGTIPSSLAQLTALRGVDFHENALSGTIPSYFFEMKSLIDLWLYDNVLTGSLPQNMGNATAMSSFSGAVNFLTGSLPAGLGTMQHLRGLDLYDNSFVGQLPRFAENHPLEELYLGNSQFSGSIPTTLGNCKNLWLLQIHGASLLSGTVPAEITALPGLQQVQISGTSLSGTLPIFTSQNIGWVSLFDNRLSGGLEEFFAKTPTSLFKFYVKGNLLEGSIPNGIANYTLLNLINLSNNSLTGTIVTEFGLLRRLTSLSLVGNELNGTIPAELGQRTTMVEMTMAANRLEGQLPSELGLMSFLKTLIVSSNRLTGTIPTSIAKLESLQSLEVYNNSFRGDLDAFCNRTETVLIAADCSELRCECCAVCCDQQAACSQTTSSI